MKGKLFIDIYKFDIFKNIQKFLKQELQKNIF